ncbi:uncharacterized protein SAPINGB_P003407 [Magnusiomyces paraingens]|uniref:Major facilitator superfamily (MFS) profile domain-containing protein n=1 Tax=Magnusiomyces paraingens TaxID=2606893 RepID=A0A5E8BUN7_9ASCO|nr:uncharacterized protein SAPINGB_P003407 [Saprochaete ingens]VVT53107.1 unnamed protein product [Saprochaete ingens]
MTAETPIENYGATTPSSTAGSDNDSVVDPKLVNGRESWNYPPKNVLKTVAMFWGMISFGMNDASVGVLVKSLEQHYQISYTSVSYIFLLGFTGYLISAFVCEIFHRHVGRWGTLTLGGFFQLVCFILAYTMPPFPIFVIGYFISGFGNGLIEASSNAWAGNLNNNNEMLGLLHGFYGLGGIISPFVTTTLLVWGYQWNTVYFFLAVMTSLSTILIFYAYSDETAEHYKQIIERSIKEQQQHPEETSPLLPGIVDNELDPEHHHHDPNNVLMEIDPAMAIEKSTHGQVSAFRETLQSKLALLLSFSLFMAVGAEITFSGWIPIYMIDVRHGDEKQMGYVGTAYWAGMTLGRMGLGFVTSRSAWSEELWNLVYILCTLASIAGFWFVPSIAVSSVCAVLIGFFNAPLYPTSMVVFIKKFPEHLHVVGVGLLAACGGVGGALGPFLNGVLTTQYGAFVLAPFTFSLLVAMLISWIILMKKF